MNKTTPSAEAAAEAGIMSVLAPMQESLERLRKTSERLSTIYTEIAAEQANFLQHTLFDTLQETRTLAHVREPSEFFVLANEFVWQQAERSFVALSEIGSEICNCWLDALKSAPSLAPKAAKSRSLH